MRDRALYGNEQICQFTPVIRQHAIHHNTAQVKPTFTETLVPNQSLVYH